jgi:hypothetical protein
VKLCSTKSTILAVAFALAVVAAIPLAQVQAVAPPNDQAGAGGDQAVASPSATSVSITREHPSVTITINIEGPIIDIGVNDQYMIGDEFTVTLDGDPLFQTSKVPQPTSNTVCTELPPGNLASCVAEQAAGQVVQTGYGGCDLATAFGAGLSWGDLTPILAGIHTLVITDVAPSFTNGVIDSPASLCVTLEPPPSFTTPEFPPGMGIVVGVAFVGLVLAKRAGMKAVGEAS